MRIAAFLLFAPMKSRIFREVGLANAIDLAVPIDLLSRDLVETFNERNESLFKSLASSICSRSFAFVVFRALARSAAARFNVLDLSCVSEQGLYIYAHGECAFVTVIDRTAKHLGSCLTSIR